MGRSLKKGPFVNAKLLKAIEEMNAKNLLQQDLTEIMQQIRNRDSKGDR